MFVCFGAEMSVSNANNVARRFAFNLQLNLFGGECSAASLLAPHKEEFPIRGRAHAARGEANTANVEGN